VWKVLATAVLAVPAAAQHTFDGNLLAANGTPPGNLNYENSGGAGCAALHAALMASPLNKSLVALPGGFWVGAPQHPGSNWQPTTGSLADGTAIGNFVSTIQYVTAVPDSCDTCGVVRDFDQPCFLGAVPPPNLGADWTQGGWLCTTDLGVCLPALNAPTMWSGTYGPGGGTPGVAFTMSAASTHVLVGKVTILAGATLTIDPGTVVLGNNATAGYLAIDRGAKIFANGTVNSPIIMSTDLAVPVSGGWGGLVIHGRAVANCADCLGGLSCASEGDAGNFCGTNDCDDSGALRYVRVQYSGIEISPNNELNSFTFNAVGSSTVAEFLQAHQGSDDAFEWFGGTANANHLVATGMGDDGVDWQMGFRGTVQYAIVQMYPTQGDKGIEADNNEFNFDAPCRSNPLIANCTFVGPPTGGTPTATSAIHLRRGTNAQIFNSILFAYPRSGLRLENAQTCTAGANAYPTAFSGCATVDAQVLANGIVDLKVRAFPNPVVDRTQFSFHLPAACDARLDVYDLAGRLVANVVDDHLTAGDHSVVWRPESKLAAGAYFYRLANGASSAMGKFVVVN
jgi:hypothetical protein